MKNDTPLNFSLREHIILVFTLTGLSLSTLLVLNDNNMRGYCPYISGIPSCHITADGFILILLSLFLLNSSLKKLLFSAGMTLGLSVSIYFSAMHLMMINPSPEFLDISTSYITVFLFFAVLVARSLTIGRHD